MLFDKTDPLYNHIDNDNVDPNTKDIIYLHILSSIANDTPLADTDLLTQE